MTEKKYILSKEVATRKLRRMALQVAEQNYEEPELVLVGIKENGVIIAEKIREYLAGIFQGTITLVTLSIDKKQPLQSTVHPATDFTGKALVLIDDVANSGSTMLYALKPLLEGYPKKIQTLALVERTHKSFPIDVDYVGISISTTLNEHINVEVEAGEVGGAWMEVED